MNKPQLLIHPDAQRMINGLLEHPPHAVVLTSDPGIGKTLIAAQLAEQLLDSSVGSGNNPYFREVKPIKGVINIEQVRNLIKFFQLSVPGRARVKRVAIIQDADTLGREAQNALLKLLEEPPEGSVLLLTSSAITDLLPTILSRVQQYVLPTPTAQMITGYMLNVGYEPTAVQAAVLRHGSAIAAIVATLTSDNVTDSSLDLVKQTLRASNFERLAMVDSMSKQKEQANTFVDTLATVAWASLQAAANKGSAITRWRQVLEAAHNAQEALSRSGNTKLVLTELMLIL